eukprot:CAMPEP_0194777286 /NCGR_PEP_ID=MMETSP0323_2-20130528/65298_1 /TAXON_ID=2866 ORGANISM="Crypthecodinium cohnii, Strain Seligo" /NCGR_SAMPLE_ID=MMETSP0323_2 /ASSEMBLY_ACC=CAM_ASM_000346 /LENGTH=42 /DNA_ID= /DNA_START= /DNA_END= /DNA_ORIENTATION=
MILFWSSLRAFLTLTRMPYRGIKKPSRLRDLLKEVVSVPAET